MLLWSLWNNPQHPILTKGPYLSGMSGVRPWAEKTSGADGCRCLWQLREDESAWAFVGFRASQGIPKQREPRDPEASRVSGDYPPRATERLVTQDPTAPLNVVTRISQAVTLNPKPQTPNPKPQTPTPSPEPSQAICLRAVAEAVRARRVPASIQISIPLFVWFRV